MKIILLPLCTRFQLWKFACRLSWARFSFAFGSGNSHFVQLLFLLGAVPYVQRQEVRFSAKCHYRMERPYGVAGIRLSLGTDLPGEQRGLIPNAKFMIKHIGALGTDLR